MAAFKACVKYKWAPLVELSRVMNTVAGGNDYRKSGIGKWANPAAMQHLITNYTGGVGQLIGDVSSAFSDAITGDLVENFDMMKVPVAKRGSLLDQMNGQVGRLSVGNISKLKTKWMYSIMR